MWCTEKSEVLLLWNSCQEWIAWVWPWGNIRHFMLEVAMIWIWCAPLDSHSWVLMANVMVLEGETFGRCSSHGGKTLINEISALSKRVQRDPSPFHYARTQWVSCGREPGRGPHQNITRLAPWPWTSSTVRNKCLLFLSYPACGIFLWQPECSKTEVILQDIAHPSEHQYMKDGERLRTCYGLEDSLRGCNSSKLHVFLRGFWTTEKKDILRTISEIWMRLDGSFISVLIS